MIAAQILIDAFAEVLTELGESVTLHRDGGDEPVNVLLSLDAMGIGLADGAPVGQTATLKLAIADQPKLDLATTPVLTVTARSQIWHIGAVETDRIGYVQVMLRLTDNEFKHTNIHDMNDEQIRWADE